MLDRSSKKIREKADIAQPHRAERQVEVLSPE